MRRSCSGSQRHSAPRVKCGAAPPAVDTVFRGMIGRARKHIVTERGEADLAAEISLDRA